MNHVDVVQRHLARLELDIHRLGLVECPRREALAEREIGAVLVQVFVQPPRGVRARNHAQAAVLDGRRFQRDPCGAGRERSNRPVVPVLMPRRLVAFLGRLAEYMAAPEDYVVAEHTGNQLHDLGIAGKIQERAAAAHALPVVAFDVRRDELFWTHAGVVAQQPLERLHNLGNARRR